MTAATPVGSSAAQSIGIPLIPLLINRSVMSLAALSVNSACLALIPALTNDFILVSSPGGIVDVILTIFVPALAALAPAWAILAVFAAISTPLTAVVAPVWAPFTAAVAPLPAPAVAAINAMFATSCNVTQKGIS